MDTWVCGWEGGCLYGREAQNKLRLQKKKNAVDLSILPGVFYSECTTGVGKRIAQTKASPQPPF